MIKKLLNKLRSGSFWVTLVGALTLILSRLGYADASTLAENIINAIASILLIFGIAVSPAREEVEKENSDTEDKEDDK